MALYDFECSKCGTSEHFAGMDEKVIPCDCGQPMKRLITSRYAVIPDKDFVTDDITGEPVRITSKHQLKRLCAENDCAESFGKGWM